MGIDSHLGLRDRPTLFTEISWPQFHALRRLVQNVLDDSGVWGEMAIEYEGDLDFGEASTFDFPQVKNAVPEYGDISKTFYSSVHRVIALGWLPAELAYWSGLLAICSAETRRQLGEDILSNDSNHTEEAIELFSKLASEVSPFKGRTPEEGAMMLFEQGNKRIKSILQEGGVIVAGRHRVMGLQAILSAMLTTAYAALEAMAADLWIAAVNRHPILAARVMEKGDKQISGAVLAGYGFNAAHVMGKILSENKKVSFQSFYDIKSSYEAAFGNLLPDLFADIGGVVMAEKVRHLIAHRGGLVDAKFKIEAKDFAEYANVEIGDMLPLTGPIVGKHIDACVKFGVSLFNAVDEWSVTADTE